MGKTLKVFCMCSVIFAACFLQGCSKSKPDIQQDADAVQQVTSADYNVIKPPDDGGLFF